LQSKLAEARDRMIALAGDRDVIAYDAHTGDQKARKRLDAISAELATMGSETESIQAAIVEAERRVKEAEGVARSEQERANAEAALALGARLRDQARAVDDALAVVFSGFKEISDLTMELRRLGVGPSEQMVSVSFKTVMRSAATGSRLRDIFEAIAPVDRRTMTDFTGKWDSLLCNHADRVLDHDMPAPKIRVVA
jgi:hypothetical protein